MKNKESMVAYCSGAINVLNNLINNKNQEVNKEEIREQIIRYSAMKSTYGG